MILRTIACDMILQTHAKIIVGTFDPRLDTCSIIFLALYFVMDFLWLKKKKKNYILFFYFSVTI